MTTIRFRYDTDSAYDRGTVHDFDEAVAELYLTRGCAETPLHAAFRIAIEMNDAQIRKDFPHAAELEHELADLSNRHLNTDQKAQLTRVISSLKSGTMDEKREDKMLRSAKHK